MAVSIRQNVTVRMGRVGDRPTEFFTFHGLADQREHFACVVGPLPEVPLVRLHSECLTGDVFGSTRCDCGPQLDEALRHMSHEGGVLLYLRQEGRGIGLFNKIDAYALQDHDVDTFEANERLGRGADERDYTVAADMLAALDVSRVELLTNNPAKVEQLRRHGVDVVTTRPTSLFVTPDNASYLAAKADKGGHALGALGDISTEHGIRTS